MEKELKEKRQGVKAKKTDSTQINLKKRSLMDPRSTSNHSNKLQHAATHCNTLQHSTARNTLDEEAWWALRSNSNHCNKLQHAATHCNTVLHEILWMRKLGEHLDLPQTTRANPVQCYSTHRKKTRSQSQKKCVGVSEPVHAPTGNTTDTKNKRKRGRKEVTARKCAMIVFRSSSCTDWKLGTYEWVMSHMNESWHIWMSHGTYEWVMAHMNESWHSSCTDCEVKDKNESQSNNVRHDSFVYDSFTCVFTSKAAEAREFLACHTA